MRAKFVNEGEISDLLKPKSKEEIRSALNFKRDTGTYEKYSHVLDNKLEDDNGDFYETVLVLQNNREWWVHFYIYYPYYGNGKWHIDQMLSLDQVISIANMKRNKSENIFPNSRNNNLYGIDKVIKEIDNVIEQYHFLKNYERKLLK